MASATPNLRLPSQPQGFTAKPFLPCDALLETSVGPYAVIRCRVIDLTGFLYVHCRENGGSILVTAALQGRRYALVAAAQLY